MDTEIYTKLKKAIDNRLYTISDVFDCELTCTGYLSKKTNYDYDVFLKADVIEPVFEILNAGEFPHLNPDFELYNSEREIDKERLLEYLKKSAYYSLNDLDIHRYHIVCSFNVKLIFLNLLAVDEEKLKLISHVKIKSFMGESEFGESKKIQL